MQHPLTHSAHGKLDMEASLAGSYIGGYRGLSLFMLIWHASWLVDWGEFHRTPLFYWYKEAVDLIHPFPLRLNLENVDFNSYATVYFYIVAGLVPFFMVFCFFAAWRHFNSVSRDGIRVRWAVLVSSLLIFSAIILGIFFLAYLRAAGVSVPHIAAESEYFYIAFCLMFFWGAGLATFVVVYIAQVFIWKAHR